MTIREYAEQSTVEGMTIARMLAACDEEAARPDKSVAAKSYFDGKLIGYLTALADTGTLPLEEYLLLIDEVMRF